MIRNFVRLASSVLFASSLAVTACSPPMLSDGGDASTDAGATDAIDRTVSPDGLDSAADSSDAPNPFDTTVLDAGEDAGDASDDGVPVDAHDAGPDSPCPPCAAGETCCGTTCVNLAIDPDHCGVCTGATAVCPGTSCIGGTCSTNCRLPFANCDDRLGNGCEVDTENDSANCGACGTRCTAGRTCNMGACVCLPGTADCNGDVGDACETATSFDPRNCGACARTCLPGEACDMGACVAAMCPAGRAECNGSGADPCEVDLVTDPAHCGGCETQCSFANAAALCISGACALGTCASGFADCDALSTDGCEIDTRTDVAHCGACGVACVADHATTRCADAGCAIDSCDPGYGDCNGTFADGCETRLDTLTHCGSCANACEARAGADVACSGGGCVYTCRAPAGDCDGDLNATGASNGCETDLTTGSRCGACAAATACQYPNVAMATTFTCDFTAPSTYRCTTTRCGYPYYDNCNGDGNDGCERYVGYDNANCGRCGFACGPSEYCRYVGSGGTCGTTGNWFACYNPATGTDRCPPPR